MQKTVDPMKRLRELVHRSALERRLHLQEIAGDAEGVMRLLGVILEIYDDAVDRLVTAHPATVEAESDDDDDDYEGEDYEDEFADGPVSAPHRRRPGPAAIGDGALDRSMDDMEEMWARGIVREGEGIDLSHSRELKYARAREAGPQPGDTRSKPPAARAAMRHLTSAELARVRDLARSRTQAVGRSDESVLALFLADMLPRFKDAESKAQDGVPLWPQDWEQAAFAAGGADASWVTLVNAAGLFEQTCQLGVYGGQRFPGEWNLCSRSFPFDSEAPRTPLYLRTVPNLDRKWRSFLAAAEGRSARHVD